MKKFLAFLIAITMLLSASQIVLADNQQQTEPVYTNIESAALALHEAIKNRQKIIELNLDCPMQNDEAIINEFCDDIFNEAVKHDFDEPDGGDFLRFSIRKRENVAVGAVLEGTDEFTLKNIKYTFSYNDTAENELALDKKLKQVMSSLKLDSMCEYDKVKTIYSYICKNVTYDYEHLNDTEYYLKHTAYAALIDGTAVCQGYALLFYRMALAAGLDCRIISGKSKNEDHAWNIVKIESKYYLVDSTWDSQTDRYNFFLKSASDFEGHTADTVSQSIISQYDISSVSYITGDIDNNGTVDSDDAVRLLYYVFFPEQYNVTKKTDFNEDDHVDSDDAVYLLYHAFFPGQYPLFDEYTVDEAHNYDTLRLVLTDEPKHVSAQSLGVTAYQYKMFNLDSFAIEGNMLVAEEDKESFADAKVAILKDGSKYNNYSLVKYTAYESIGRYKIKYVSGTKYKLTDSDGYETTKKFVSDGGIIIYTSDHLPYSEKTGKEVNMLRYENDWLPILMPEEYVNVFAIKDSSENIINYLFITDYAIATLKKEYDIEFAILPAKECTVTFKDYDGTVLKVEKVIYGMQPTEPTQPKATGHYEGHIFSKWDKDISCIVSDITVTAQYVNEFGPLQPFPHH